ncbi:MAG: Crp/Fnr family transcriptional regulator [Saprospiraceae bacterium]|uniref:Crp/Fnr family transcriptional regulator n=1 Tax=Candidatus Opimibacter skivensis TaxID=2982028 RepID=A0A9D7XRP0_9BACT|nr:Crp/Fnr family transcriptional regulator [Candidatus Opimibacter skivensis]
MITSPLFLKFIRSAPDVKEEEVTMILDHFTILQVKAKDHTVREGEICKHIGFVNKGCFSYYTLSESGRKSIIHFAFEDWWTGDLQSFLKRQPATTYWQALEEAELITINRSDFEHLCKISQAFKYLFDLKTQTAYIKILNKSAKDKSETAEEKYLRMLEEYPQIIQRVPHYDVASYLGIAPESLSRIRNKISK